MMTDFVAGRAYARVYKTSKRVEIHGMLIDAVGRAGGRLLYASDHRRAPVYLGVETPAGERIGIMTYPFTATHNVIKNRPSDEHRLQIRYGGVSTWAGDHGLGRDAALVDTTLVLGVHRGADLFIGLDPRLYDPLPMGISIEFKQAHVDAAQASGWHVFERDNITGRRRPDPRATQGLEAVVLFQPHRLLDYVRLERQASDLHLDPPLRFAAAKQASSPSGEAQRSLPSLHDLEQQFQMTAPEIMEMISDRKRLTVAVRGGVAEHHLNRVLSRDLQVARHQSLDEDGQHDFDVTLVDGRGARVECKNASPQRYANGDIKVEVQKTRATQGDPAGRFYRRDQFDVVAACLYAPTGEWRFVYRSTSQMEVHPKFPDRLAPLQHVTDEWSASIADAL
ncbi:hypothetical protein L083_0208 [Actinoplanes sp. N902-109]|nr:hypothetical protein L083_0208 [Actinoplanes sp. N902-109]